MDGNTVVIIKSTGRKGRAPGEFEFPNGIRLNKAGEIYVCDSDNHRVQVFDRDLNFLRKFGRRGSGKGCFDNPADLDFDEAGNLYIAEQRNLRIQVLTPQGDHIRYIGEGVLHDPVSPAVHQNMVYVTDVEGCRIAVFTTSGEFRTSFGEKILQRPEGITIDNDGFVYVTDARSRLIKF